MLTTLVSVSPIYASFDADEGVIAKALKDLPGGASARTLINQIPVQMGTAASTGTPFEGRLQLIDNQVDARSGTVRVRAAFDNKDGALIPGQFARIRMGQARSSNVMLVSERAIGTDQSVVTSGLKSGERVVVNGLQHVRPGALVAPQAVPMDPASAQAPATAATASKVASNS